MSRRYEGTGTLHFCEIHTEDVLNVFEALAALIFLSSLIQVITLDRDALKSLLLYFILKLCIKLYSLFSCRRERYLTLKVEAQGNCLSTLMKS